MATCYIFAAGSFYGLTEYPSDGDFVIAADAGLKHCTEAWVAPDLILGDFDSLGEAPEGGDVLHLPVEKDDTDTIYAMRVGLERGYTDFVVYGGTGGSRADHTIANLQGLLFLSSHGAHCRMYGDGVVWSVLHNEKVSFPAGCGGTLSLFCMDGAAREMRHAAAAHRTGRRLCRPLLRDRHALRSSYRAAHGRFLCDFCVFFGIPCAVYRSAQC